MVYLFGSKIVNRTLQQRRFSHVICDVPPRWIEGRRNDSSTLIVMKLGCNEKFVFHNIFIFSQKINLMETLYKK